MRRRHWISGLLLALGIAVALLGVRAWRAVDHARLAVAEVRALQAAGRSGKLTDLPAMEHSLLELERQLVATETQAAPFLWVAPAFGWVPRYGSTIAQAPLLLDMAVEAAGAGHDALVAAAPVIEAMQGEGDRLERLLPRLAEAGPALEPLDRRMDRLKEQRAALAPGMLPSVTVLLEQFDEWMPLARVGLRGAGLAPELLGHDGPRTYLVLAQNSDELRATGGFISAAGSVRLEKGRITDLRVGDSYALDNLAQPHPPAPAALAEQMGAQMLVLRDSNWSPDYPTSAAEARGLYLQDQGVATDGAIAIDLEAIRLLVGALAPLDVPGFPPLTGDNVLQEMKRAWATPANSTAAIGSGEWWKQRKDFMAPLLLAALAKLQGGGDLDAARLGTALTTMLQQKHLQIAVDNAEAAALLAEAGWDGGLRLPPESDLLAIVDSNVGFNKANASVRQEVVYEAVNSAEGVTATLSITYIHSATSGEQQCDRTPRYSDTYEGMQRRCYWDYLRVFLPPDSRLLAGEGLENIHTEVAIRNMTVIAGSFVLPVGGRHTVRLRYTLPQAVPAAPYRLLVRRQAGAAPFSALVRAGVCEWQGPVVGDLAFSCPSLEKR